MTALCLSLNTVSESFEGVWLVGGNQRNARLLPPPLLSRPFPPRRQQPPHSLTTTPSNVRSSSRWHAQSASVWFQLIRGRDGSRIFPLSRGRSGPGAFRLELRRDEQWANCSPFFTWTASEQSFFFFFFLTSFALRVISFNFRIFFERISQFKGLRTFLAGVSTIHALRKWDADAVLRTFVT